MTAEVSPCITSAAYLDALIVAEDNIHWHRRRGAIAPALLQPLLKQQLASDCSHACRWLACSHAKNSLWSHTLWHTSYSSFTPGPRRRKHAVSCPLISCNVGALEEDCRHTIVRMAVVPPCWCRPQASSFNQPGHCAEPCQCLPVCTVGWHGTNDTDRTSIAKPSRLLHHPCLGALDS